MTREEVVSFALEQGWKTWGKLRRYSSDNDSKYQAFRRGNEYLWIGLRFVERSTWGEAYDFHTDEAKARGLVT